ncbi:Mitochondrial inner membrane protease ATP23 [Termitomyces sp. J132]|nr:Mitochondrial inner membrane protease ATP23 [Termitomyces sp. J132]
MNDSEKSSSSSSLTPPSTPQPPQSAFERWRRKAALVTGIGVTEEERLADLAIHQTRHCEKTKTYLMNYSPIVVFMLRHLKLSGCEVPPENILCAPCDWSRAGGFTPDRGAVVLCSGHFFGQSHMESTLVHELMHMYDHCKFKVDWNNLRHHACSEIRANSLSGDCRYTRELRRGFASFSKQHQACVRRRAVTSVAENPACPDEATAEKAVNEVWDSCFNDTRPFDEVWRSLPHLSIQTWLIMERFVDLLNGPLPSSYRLILHTTTGCSDHPPFLICTLK